jgi:hypothetical protein
MTYQGHIPREFIHPGAIGPEKELRRGRERESREPERSRAEQ